VSEKWAAIGGELVSKADTARTYLEHIPTGEHQTRSQKMNITPRTRRIRRAALVIGGLTAAGIVALPAAAFADTSNAGLVTPGGSLCATQSANYQVRVEGTASKLGAKFRVYRNGVLITASMVDTSGGYSAELRTSAGNFPGPGSYTLCGLNKQTTNTFVTVRVRTDAEI
jgi:hypothetical protein